MNLTEEQIFEHSFVISINEHKLKVFRKRFADAGFTIEPYHWHGAQITDNYYKAFDDYPEKLVHFKWMHSLCNGFGHFFLVNMAKYLNWDFITIFEDDAIPVENAKELMKIYCTDIPDDADILKLGYTSERSRQKMLYRDEKFVSINQKGSHAYIVFKKEYDRFLSDSIINPRADIMRFNPHPGVNSYSCIVPLFLQKDIEGEDHIHINWSSDSRPSNGWRKNPLEYEVVEKEKPSS